MAHLRTAGLLAVVMGAGLWSCSTGSVSPGDSTTAAGGGALTTTTAGAGGAAPACVPQAQVACACLSGRQGVQVCKPDGTGYEPCQGCEGGTGGHGGAASTTAATSTAASTTAATTAASSTTAATTSTTAATTSASTGAGGAPPTMLDLHQATLTDNPPNLADWPVTTTITEVDFQYNGMDGVHVEFDKKDGAGSWPDVTPPGWNGPLEYTLGMAELINGQWYASAAIQFWRGLDASGGNVASNQQIAKNWYYDGRWGALAGRQPATGEIIGIFVVAGNARGVMSDDPLESPVQERSNVVLMPMPDVNGAKYTF